MSRYVRSGPDSFALEEVVRAFVLPMDRREEIQEAIASGIPVYEIRNAMYVEACQARA